jgi:hypothetical protein
VRTGSIALSICLVAIAGCAAPAGASDTASPGAISGTPGPSGLRAACVGLAAEGEPLKITIESEGDVFSTDHISGPRHCQPFVIVFTNNDPILHNVAISTEELGQGEYLLFGEKITGPETIRYEVAGIPAGDYFFVCTLHWQSMNGSLTVAAALRA